MAKKDMRGLKNHMEEEEVEKEEEEEVTFGTKLRRIRDRLKLGPHYKMERFSISLAVYVTLLLLVVILSFVHYRGDVKVLESTQARITEDFRFSLSGQTMDVVGVYGDKNKTDVMVLLEMGDANSMSTNARNYELFITGQSDSLSYTPKTSLAFFGATGYAIIRFQSETPLPKEVMRITIRAKSEIAGRQGPGTSGDDNDDDESFAEYDQGRLYVNPGADGVEPLEKIEPGETDPTKLYVALVAAEKDEEIKEEIQVQTQTLQKLMNQEAEYRNRIVAAGYIPPEKPWFMQGDYVDNDGVFRPSKDVRSAYVFDYYTKTIYDGYITQLMSGLSEFDDYMQTHDEKVREAEQDPSQEEKAPQVDTVQHKDGTTLNLGTVSSSSSPSVQVAVQSAVISLQNVWSSYLKVKMELQNNNMHDLLVLDADVLSQTAGFSENNNKEAFTFY